jgi:prolyl 4-hydroxylase
LPGITGGEKKATLDAGGTRVLCEAPRIAITADVADSSLMTAMISYAHARLSDARVSDTVAEGVISNGRICQAGWFRHDENEIVAAVVDLICTAAGMEASLSEQLHVIRYGPGGQYRPHFDSYDLDSERGRQCTARRGQRTHSAILYLNDGIVGGATKFPKLGLEIPPRAGAVLAFENCVRGTVLRHENSLHAGGPVEAGEKWIATLWFRQRPA